MAGRSDAKQTAPPWRSRLRSCLVAGIILTSAPELARAQDPEARGAAAGTAPAAIPVPAPRAASAPPAEDPLAPRLPPDAATAPPRRRRMVASLSHRFQFGLSVLIGDGFRGVFPYQDGRVCGDARGGDSARVCTNRAPAFADLQPSYGLTHTWDVLCDLRFGLRPDFTTKYQFFVMPGVRYWLDPESHVKFFTTVQLAYDRSDQNQVGVRNYDLAFRNSNGLMVEIMRNFGAYAQFGETIGFVRWLSFMVDGGLGVEARFP